MWGDPMAVFVLLSHGKVKLHAAAWKALAGEGNDSAEAAAGGWAAERTLYCPELAPAPSPQPQLAGRHGRALGTTPVAQSFDQVRDQKSHSTL